MHYMETTSTISIQRTTRSGLSSVDWKNFEFGKYVSDHMFRASYKNGAWSGLEIIPFGDISISPTTLALHYGQSVFEGMKAFRMEDGRVNIFRVEKHHERLNTSLERMCMPPVPFDLFHTALHELVALDSEWVPGASGSALYIRPLVFASEAKMGVKVSDEYQFLIITGPVPALYSRPIKVKVERKFIRAARGGTGYAKCAGNYGGAFYPTQKAKEEGYDQVIWTDAFEHEYFEESGTMNLMFVIDGKLVTPPLSDSILDGVTRDSLLQIAADLEIPFEERAVGVNEVIRAFQQGNITEAFGAGTAAVVAPIELIGIDGIDYLLPSITKDSLQSKLKKELEDIRGGRTDDVNGWNEVIG
jgi:branched-chain amino acid aminotransferase